MPTGIYKRTQKQLDALRLSQTPEARAKANAKIRAKATDSAWREKVSRATKEAMHRVDVRERHLAAIPKKVNFKHGNGQEASPLILLIEKILAPLGFKRECIILTKGHATFHNPPRNYKADFANVATKTIIELDGPKYHTMEQKKLDEKKTEVLESLGWTVIRVPHKKLVFY